nr:hypothetical protein CFP56_09174 [Quercus suber]
MAQNDAYNFQSRPIRPTGTLDRPANSDITGVRHRVPGQARAARSALVGQLIESMDHGYTNSSRSASLFGFVSIPQRWVALFTYLRDSALRLFKSLGNPTVSHSNMAQSEPCRPTYAQLVDSVCCGTASVAQRSDILGVHDLYKDLCTFILPAPLTGHLEGLEIRHHRRDYVHVCLRTRLYPGALPDLPAHKIVLEGLRFQLHPKLPLCRYSHLECRERRIFCGHRLVRCSPATIHALNLIFSLGLLVVGAGSARTYYSYLLGAQYDPSWIGYNLYVWSDLELQLSIICASAPVMRVFFRKYLSSSMSRMLNSAKTGTNNLSRGSHALDPEAVTKYVHQQTPSHDSQLDDKLLIKHQVQTGMQPLPEDECPSPSTVGPTESIIRTPADFEAYALRNLEQNRPPLRSSGSRARNDEKGPASPGIEWMPTSKY